MLEALFWSLLIFLARLIDVSMGTMRMILLVRGKKEIATISSFFEIMIWILAISRVITQLDRWYYMVAFALGFACGNFMGSYLEEKIALGYAFAYVIPRKNGKGLVKEIRAAGFGATVLHGEGLHGPEIVLNVVMKRHDAQKFLKLLKKHDPHAFFTLLDVRSERGGYFGGMRKGK